MNSFSLSDFDYELPSDLIAKAPANPRDSARLLLLNRTYGTIEHTRFSALPELLTPDTVLVINDTKVMPSRLVVAKKTGGKVELLLLESTQESIWKVLSKPGLKKGNVIKLGNKRLAEVIASSDSEGIALIQFYFANTQVFSLMHAHGVMPLPPYIKSNLSQAQLKKAFQTVFARDEGSSAAPTASLHFTKRLMKRLELKGITIVPITLSVGLGTFKSLTSDSINQSELHAEHYYIPPPTTEVLFQAKKTGKRIVAVGTTVTRALESSAQAILNGKNSGEWNTTKLFIKPPHAFKLVDSLITNFHLTESSLLMLVSAFCSTPNAHESFHSFADSMLGHAYQQAIENHYRFFSFGDAMLIE